MKVANDSNVRIVNERVQTSDTSKQKTQEGTTDKNIQNETQQETDTVMKEAANKKLQTLEEQILKEI